MRLLLLLATLAATGTIPALAWDYSERFADDELWISAFENEPNGNQLAVSCSDWFPEESDITVYGSRDYDTTASYADEVPLTIIVDGVETGPLPAGFENFGGKEAVIIYEDEDDRVRPLFDAMRDAKSEIVVTYFNTRLTFTAENVSRSIGNFLDICDGIPVF